MPLTISSSIPSWDVGDGGGIWWWVKRVIGGELRESDAR